MENPAEQGFQRQSQPDPKLFLKPDNFIYINRIHLHVFDVYFSNSLSRCCRIFRLLTFSIKQCLATTTHLKKQYNPGEGQKIKSGTMTSAACEGIPRMRIAIIFCMLFLGVLEFSPITVSEHYASRQMVGSKVQNT